MINLTFKTPTLQTPWAVSSRKYTPEKIKELKDNEYFVFGSNLSGKHGAGAAAFAMNHGAIWGKGYGLQGKTFGIPTKAANIKDVLSLHEIRSYVNAFKVEAVQNFRKIFLVTKIGCGLANPYIKELGWTKEAEQKRIQEIGPMFKGCSPNVILPIEFEKYR